VNITSADRFGSFFSRVDSERAVLRTVNSTFGAHAVLHGITLAAIDHWRTQMRLNLPSATAIETDVIPLLLRISARCNAEADHSRVVFDDPPDRTLIIEELLTELRAACG